MNPARGINVLDLRVEVAKPDGSGVAVITLKADPTDANAPTLTGFNITSINFINAAQTLRLWDSFASDCSGSLLTATPPSNQVPADGQLCFFSNTTAGATAEFQNSFQYIALGSGASNNGTVTLINYNRQSCTSIPDLAPSGSYQAPPTPKVSITLSGLEIKFSVNATYLRNQTAWFMDFWNFDNSPGGDSIDGTGRTCSNHLPANYPSRFYDWWYSGVRATYTNAIDPSITDALGSSAYPNYKTSGTVWSIVALDCSTVKFEATIPISRLIGNDTSDCHRTGDISAAALAEGGLTYSGNLYINALRPVDRYNSSAGYYRSSFVFPFSFSIEMTVTDISSTSAAWSFAVAVLSSQVTYSGGSPSFSMDMQTSINSDTVPSPNVISSGFSVSTYPWDTLRDSIGSSVTPTLTRLTDNGQCGTGSSSSCVIQWRMVMPQLSLAQLSNSQADFDTQYVGKYSFRWITQAEGDILAADIYIDVSAKDPLTNLTQLPVTSSLDFFDDSASMFNTSRSGLATPQFSSGEKIWARHSFLVNPSDASAFIFTLRQAWVCFSRVPGYVPYLTNGGTGCSADIPGVMEAANGERFTLYDRFVLSEGIQDVVGSLPGQQSTIWNWTLVTPQNSGWSPSGSKISSGFSINAQPLAADEERTYYFHLVSTVSQAVRREETTTVHQVVRAATSSLSPGLQGVKIMSSASTTTSAASSTRPYAASFLSSVKKFLGALLL